MKFRSAVLGLVGAMIGCALSLPSVSADAAASECNSVGTDGGAEAVNALVAKLESRGASDKAVDAVLATQLCLERIDNGVPGDAAVRARSTNSDVAVTPPSIYWDSQAQRYYAISKWNWTGYSFGNEINAYWDWRNLGGADAFGTSFNKGLLLTGYSLTTNSDTGGSTSVDPASDANSSGVGYRFQDRIKCTPVTSGPCSWRLSVGSGQEVISFKKSGTCKSIYGFAKYAHTWSSTSVNSVSIGPWSIGIGTNDNAHHWSAVSQPGGTATVC